MSYSIIFNDAHISLQGLIMDRHSYFRSGWNIMDATIVLFSWLDLNGVVQGGQIKIIRMARALRPLRLIRRNKSLRVLMEVCMFQTFDFLLHQTTSYEAILKLI